MLPPYFIGNLEQCSELLIVAAILAAFIPLAEQVKSLPDYSKKARLAGQFLIAGPYFGALISLFAIALCLLYAWLPGSLSDTRFGDWLLGASFAFLCLAVVVFFGVAIVGLLFVSKKPQLAEMETTSEEDLARLIRQRDSKLPTRQNSQQTDV